MTRLYLGLVLHDHQPVGNYDFVVEDVFRRAYAPMLAALGRHPEIRVALHTSGCLFDWLEVHHPDYVEQLAALVARGQVEPLTGGYYEPILPVIPEVDRAGQIARLTEYVHRRLGAGPTGLWLAERVWEPALPRTLAGAGVRWTLVDDAHFRMTGIAPDAIDGYFLTEEEGCAVRLFGGSQRLRYIIPWRPVEDVIAELRAIADATTSDAPYVLLGDDGEKFGAWPGTYAHVWEDGWVDAFFEALARERSWLELITPGEYERRVPARGLVYLPAASYTEMMEWAMPADASARFRRLRTLADEESRPEAQFLQGGFWRSFLSKYPESNAMHKRGLRIDARLRAHESADAREALWAGQCNCPYWHGVFGGLYLRHIRRAANANLVRAERLADIATPAPPIRAVAGDVDYDGQDEVLLQSDAVSLLVHPALGGMLSEFDVRHRDTAVLDVLARRPEAYHAALTAAMTPEDFAQGANIHDGLRVKQAGLSGALVYDRFRRGGLQEWLLDAREVVEAFAAGIAAESVSPLGSCTVDLRHDASSASLRLARSAAGWVIEKTIVLRAGEEAFAVVYDVRNTAAARRSARFVSEWNIAPPQVAGGDDRIARLECAEAAVDLAGRSHALPATSEINIAGSAAWSLRCELDPPCEVWTFPVQTVSSSEGGVELVPQGYSISFTLPLQLMPGASFSLRLSWSTSAAQAGVLG